MSNKQRRNYQLKPLMYIVQPDNDNINVNMQAFVTKKQISKLNTVSDHVPSQVQTLEKEAIPQEREVLEIPEEIISKVEVPSIQEEAIEQEQSARQYRKQRKPITQMSIEEKIEFFTNLPKNMPRTLCQIETAEEKYRGVILSEENEVVLIRSLTHSKPIELPLSSISAINLLGF